VKHTSLKSEIAAHEYVQLMVMKNCPMSVLSNCKNLRDCEKCTYRDKFQLRDRKGVHFNIERQNKLTYIYNSVPLTIIGIAADFADKNIDYFLVDTKYLEDAGVIIDALYSEIKGLKSNYALEENKFTRGHYLKNVL